MRSRRAAGVVLLGLALFVALTVLVSTGAADGVDRAVARLGARHQSSAAVTAAQVLTDVFQPLVDAVVLLAGAAFLAWRRRSRRLLAVAIGVVVGVSTVVLAVKYAVDRPLPHSHGHADQGFPSGHTAATLCFLGALAVLVAGNDVARRRRLLTGVAVLTLAVVTALVDAGFHWLTDTLASLALGMAVIAALTLARLDRTPIDP